MKVLVIVKRKNGAYGLTLYGHGSLKNGTLVWKKLADYDEYVTHPYSHARTQKNQIDLCDDQINWTYRESNSIRHNAKVW